MEQSGQKRSVIRWFMAVVSLALVVPLSRPGADQLFEEAAVIAPGLEVAAALELRDEFLADARLVDDAALVKEVNRVGRLVAAKSDRPDLPYAFYVLESGDEAADYQAMSLPGGTIAVTHALAKLLVESEDELAFVLAHEVAHVALRHHLAHLPEDGSKAWRLYAESIERHHEFVADRYGALYLVRSGLRFGAAGHALSRIAGKVGNRKLNLKHHPSYEQRVEQLEGFLPELNRSKASFDQGAELMREGRIDDALEALTVFVHTFPHSVAGRVNLGTVCLMQLARESGSPGGLEEPFPFLENSGIVVRGVYDGELLQRARHNFRQALAIQPTSNDALIGLALIEQREGNYGESRRLLTFARDAETPRFLLARGNACYLDDDHQLAVELYLKALKGKHGWSAAEKNLALAYEELGRPDLATQIWLGLLDESRIGSQARWHLVLLQSGDD